MEIADLVAAHHFIAARPRTCRSRSLQPLRFSGPFGFSPPRNRGTPHDFQMQQ
jgi:hypothetical protein